MFINVHKIQTNMLQASQMAEMIQMITFMNYSYYSYLANMNRFYAINNIRIVDSERFDINPIVPDYPSGFNMITPTVAIGDKYSSYDSFDVIINLNYPQNGAKQLIETRETPAMKIYYNLIILDSEQEKGVMLSLLRYLIPELSLLHQSNPDLRFLFHCYAGMSRSPTVAIAFLVKNFNMTLDEALLLSVLKRPIILPNSVFVEELKQYVLN